MYCSYSGFNSYDKCPFSYWHRYINKTQPPELDNRVNMLFGASTGVVFEQFYNEKMWRLRSADGQPGFLAEMLSRVPRVIKKVIADETADGKHGVLHWNAKNANYHSIEDLTKDVEDAVRRGLKSIKHHRLVGHEAGAEIKLDSMIGEHKLGGRVDISVRRVPASKPGEEGGDKIILDGKGSKFREGYVDKRQLRWYALLHQERFKTLPDKTGFLYWRCEPEASIDWVKVTAEDTALLKKLVITTLDKIEDHKRRLPVVPEPTPAQAAQLFPAQPSRDCKWCNYLSACEDGTRFMKNKGHAPMPNFDGDSSGTGVDDVGL